MILGPRALLLGGAQHVTPSSKFSYFRPSGDLFRYLICALLCMFF
jgi:hypothetical protein